MRTLVPPPAPFEPPTLLYLSLQQPLKLLLYILYHTQTTLRASRLTPKPPHPQPIRIVCISDTHDHTPSTLPPGDILIHAGDLTNSGSLPDLQATINWLSTQPHAHKFVISGNHDTYLDARVRGALLSPDRTGNLDWKDVRYLQHGSASVTVRRTDGKASNSSSTSPTPTPPPRSRTITISGLPQTPLCGPKATSAFSYPRHLDAWTGTIPAETHVLVTHTPPLHHRDLPLPRGLGCKFLLREAERVKPAVWVCGHVHWGAGTEVLFWDEAQRAYERGLERRDGCFGGVLDVGLWVECVRVLVFGVVAVLWERVWGGGTEGTRLVNAAVVKGNTGGLAETVGRVVEI